MWREEGGIGGMGLMGGTGEMGGTGFGVMPKKIKINMFKMLPAPTLAAVRRVFSEGTIHARQVALLELL